MNKITILIISFLISSVISSGMYELFKEKQKQKEFEESLREMIDLVNIKDVAKCIEENFKGKNDIEFVENLKNYSIGNYYNQKYFLFKKYKKYKKCIKKNTHYYENGKFKREYYY